MRLSAKLPPLELECMQALWKLRTASVSQVRAALERPLAYTTVMTVLERLAAKGAVERRKQGRAFVYGPLLDLETARSEAVERLLALLFENDREALAAYVARFRPGERAVAARPARPPRPRKAAYVPPYIDDSLL